MLQSGIVRPAFTNLIRNYRSHPAILVTPSLLFYNDTLEPEAAETETLLRWPRWPKKSWPILFACNSAEDDIEGDGGGWYNPQEARMACQYAADLLSIGLLSPAEICIMSPFRAQVRLLRRVAREAPFHMPGVNIGPLEAFQGLESRAVILCTTRTRNRFLDQDLAKGLGVIHEPKRFNVALTRAKHGLIVIGNPEILVLDSNWEMFLAFCHRNGLFEGLVSKDVAEILRKDRPTSRLERQLKRREKVEDLDELDTVANGVRALGMAENEDMRFWRSGIATEEAVLSNGE
jgi:helicase MOV-10